MRQFLLLSSIFLIVSSTQAQKKAFQMKDVFELEFASDPQISPDGNFIAYVRNRTDIMKDNIHSSIWLIQTDGSEHLPLGSDEDRTSSPRWSPDGKRLAYLSSTKDGTEIFVSWMETGRTARLTFLPKSPRSLSWSPDGNWLAFSMFVPAKSSPYVSLPEKPEGAEWAPSAKYIDELSYRSDGGGYTQPGYSHIFLIPQDGGTPRQLTSGEFDHGGNISWTADSKSIVFSANRREDADFQPLNSELYMLTIADTSVSQLTDRNGPDAGPVVSPDGKMIAYTGFDDEYQGYQLSKLYVLDIDKGTSRLLTEELDRGVNSPVWDKDNQSIYFSYSDEGNTKLAKVDLKGNIVDLTNNVGGTSLGRPYSSGSFSVSDNGKMAFTYTRPSHPADLAISMGEGGKSETLTHLNEDLFSQRMLGEVEEIWFESSFDQRNIQGWIVKPPQFDPSQKYPLILEIHGGPFANYGDRFSAEMQLYAAAGYVVLYINPRGSTSYGQEFGNLIHHNYPSEDYDDLISGVDAVIDQGYVDEHRLFVTGGSGGGVLSSWIVGKTDRFSAAVVAKPVINWLSWALQADGYNFYYKYWFPGLPWEHVDHYWKRSPLSLVGNVTTPTMLLTGEQDYRTPISESEQYYQALKLRKVDCAMVRIPEASHGIAARPSHLLAKVAHVLKWFETHDHEEKKAK